MTTQVTTDGNDLDALAAGFDGEVIRPADAAYDEAREVFNAMFDSRPAVIARCASTADVAAAVRFARAAGLEVAVRCGGHSVAGLSTCDGGMMIHLGGLKGIEIDPPAGIARAGGGVLTGELDAATQQHGLHVPLGRVSTTAIGGFTTGGGYGWTSSVHGLALDSLVAAEVVTGDGSVLEVSEEDNADLFWGSAAVGATSGSSPALTSACTSSVRSSSPGWRCGPSARRRGWSGRGATSPIARPTSSRLR